MKMDAVGSYETVVPTYQNTQPHTEDDGNHLIIYVN